MDIGYKLKELRNAWLNFHKLAGNKEVKQDKSRLQDKNTSCGKSRLHDKSRLYDFKAKKAEYCSFALSSALQNFRKSISMALKDYSNSELSEMMSLASRFENEKNDYAKAGKILENMADIIARLDSGGEKRMSEGSIFGSKKELMKKIPPDIKDEISADIKEIEKCFSSGCHRSVIILCGRIMETALHRKFYDVTGKDALETSPGMGLGNLIAKLKEKNVNFDPGITQQIHLINQVRVFSVHKKQEAFVPSRTQAHAILLYTIDALEKLF